ncbi:fibrillarin [Candidatus Micrarchaeota archaeon CG10_big_fil_rev_8_21_14_0_10_45_29]|nr:MAG: fibrillarin [Candidatus Micrarchaeota archaeon CG10_big_fil_rev_8_21_14_0_10_45_29]
MQKPEEIFPNIFKIAGRLATKNLTPGKRVYGEKLMQIGKTEYREWDIYKSKLAGAIKKGLKEMPIKKDSTVLYLGASTGTTASHVSDIVEDGGVFAVEFAQRSMRDLIRICDQRENLLPIFADARQPQEYAKYLEGTKADVLYQDVAQPDQAQILIKNANAYLKKGGHALFCVKSQSIDVTLPPRVVYEATIKELERAGFTTLQTLELDPYDKDHLFWHGKK